MRRLFSLSLLFGLFISLSYAQMSPMDVAKLQSISGITISEDGEQVAYLLRVQKDPLKENKPADNKLFLWNADSKQSQPLVTAGSVRGVAFRPGHNSITFLDRRDGDNATSLYELNLAGGEAQKIFEHHNSISSYAWGPNGKHIAFRAKELKEQETTDLPYSPDIYEENQVFTRAFIAMPGKSEVKQVEVEGNITGIEWSPDGQKLALLTAPTTLIDDYYMKRSIAIADVETCTEVAKIDHAGKKGMMTWSPDSKHLAFIAGADINDPVAGRLFVAPAEGDAGMNLYPNFKGKFDEVAWKDNETLIFLASEGAHSSLGTIKSNGKKFTRMIEPNGPVIKHMQRASSGNTALIVSSPNHPTEFYWLPSGSNKPMRITNSNSWLDDRKLAKQEVIRYDARDGLEIEGVLVHPLNKESGKRYPLIVSVHGGPESHVDNDWETYYSRPGQVGATDGFYVFYPNYRGSTGRGLEYTLTSQGDPAGKEFDDIVDGVKYLVEQGYVDEEKVGVMGGSYGGYATGWMATRYTDHFAAGVMFVGISNKVSKWGTTDIPNEEYLVHARKWIWEDYNFFLKRSPVYYADQCETPLLIAHGAEDPRVHPSQSMELYRHIKTRTETPVKLVFYPGEGHGNRNATARLDYNIRSMRWFHKYLQGKDVDVNAPIMTPKDMSKP